MRWKRPYKIIIKEELTGSIRIYGNSHNIPTYYKKPEWSEEEETAFKYRGDEYFISEFLTTSGLSEEFKEFDGISNDSFFSGILIKLGADDDYIKAYTFIS